MKRKVIKQGNNTLTITLPKKWVDGVGIKAGDEIEAEEKEDSLLLTNKRINIEKKIEVFFEPIDKVIIRILGNIYREGFDEVKVNFDDPKVVELIKKNENLFLGFEIISQKTKYCIIKNVANVLESEFDNMLRRMFLVTLSLAEEGLEAIKNEDFENLKNIVTLEETQNKMYNFCIRVVNRNQARIPNPSFQHLFIERLEEVGDEYRDLERYLIEKKEKPEKDILTFHQEVNQMLRLIYELYYKYEHKHISSIYDLRKNLEKRGFQLMERYDKEKIVLHHLINIIIKIYEAASPIVAINYKETSNIIY